MISRERLGRPGWKILGLLFLVAVIMAAAWGARAAAREMAFFRVRAVEVRGVRYLQPNDIISRLKIDTVILPALNKRDLEDVNESIRKEMKFVLVDDVKSVFKAALIETKKPAKPVRGRRRLRKVAEAVM